MNLRNYLHKALHKRETKGRRMQNALKLPTTLQLGQLLSHHVFSWQSRKHFVRKNILDENELNSLADHFSQLLPDYKWVFINWFEFWAGEQKNISNARPHWGVHLISQTDLEGSSGESLWGLRECSWFWLSSSSQNSQNSLALCYDFLMELERICRKQVRTLLLPSKTVI